MTSEETFQAQKIAMFRAFEASPHLGLTLAVNHEGLLINNVPQGVTWIGRYGHGAMGEMRVTVYEDGCSAPITQPEIEAAVMAIANATVPRGRVYDRTVVADNDDEFDRFYLETAAEGQDASVCNVWLIRQTDPEPIRGGGIDTELVGVTYVFDFFYWRRDLREYAAA